MPALPLKPVLFGKHPTCFKVFTADAEGGRRKQEPYFGFMKWMSALVNVEEVAIAASKPAMVHRLAQVFMVAHGPRPPALRQPAGGAARPSRGQGGLQSRGARGTARGAGGAALQRAQGGARGGARPFRPARHRAAEEGAADATRVPGRLRGAR